MCSSDRCAAGIDPDTVLWTSSKSGEGMSDILPAVVSRLPCADGSPARPLQCLLFDSWFDEYRGVVCIINVRNGVITPGMVVQVASTGLKYSVQELGLVTPHRYQTQSLAAGQVGYVILGMKTPQEAHIGDTLLDASNVSEPLPGFAPSKPMVFASVYPVDTGEFKELETAVRTRTPARLFFLRVPSPSHIACVRGTCCVLANQVSRLLLTDSSVFTSRESSVSLGMGLRCGFLGLLHMDVFFQRLQIEFDTPVIYTAPYVPYTLVCTAVMAALRSRARPAHRRAACARAMSQEMKDGKIVTVERPHDFPPTHQVAKFYERMVLASIVVPQVSCCIAPASERMSVCVCVRALSCVSRRSSSSVVGCLLQSYLGVIMRLLQDRRGEQVDLVYIDDERVMLKYHLPWQEVRVPPASVLGCLHSVCSVHDRWRDDSLCFAAACMTARQIITDFYDKLKSISAGV
jgi:GTP-binding protein LepA